MTDLEMTRLCAEAMGYKYENPVPEKWIHYDPLHDDAQAMALVKKFALGIVPIHLTQELFAWQVGGAIAGESESLNRAIVECVAKMHKASRNDKVEKE